MKGTVLQPAHAALNARMTEFQGWQVPLQYSDPQEEYHAVRSAAGLFDIGFLARIEVRGPEAEALLQDLCTIDMTRLPEGSCHYGLMCDGSGFLLADPVVFHLSSPKGGGRYLLSMNPVCAVKLIDVLRQRGGNGVVIEDRTNATAHLSLQGPKTQQLLETLAGSSSRKLKPHAVREMTIAGIHTLIARTGYTGEHGYELITPSADASAVWTSILDAGRETGLRLCGLAARDILRIEKGYAQFGSDIDETRTPIEAGLSAFIDFRKAFTGREALQNAKSKGLERKLAGFTLLDKGVPKSGGSIFSENREIGVVTSACQSPAMRAGIGLGYVVSRYAQPGQEIEIELREREIAARIVELPFYPKKK